MYARTLEIEGWIRWKIGGGGESKSPVEKSRSVELETNFLNRTKESFSRGQFRFSPFFFFFFFSRYRYWLERNVSPLARIDRIVKGGGQKDERRKSFLSKDAIVRPLRILHHEDDPSKLICSGFVIVGERKKRDEIGTKIGNGWEIFRKSGKS